MNSLEGKIALVTGAGRGMGRRHAVRLAEAGADVIVNDFVGTIDSIEYPLSTCDDLDETVRLVQATGRRAYQAVADVRERDELRGVVDAGVKDLGGALDIVVANAGIAAIQRWDETSAELWADIIDVNLTGVWNTVTVSAPHLLASGGGSIICIGSTASTKGLPYQAPYVAAKHGVVGIATSFANELARQNVRVNVVSPTAVQTPLVEGLEGLGMRELFETDPHLTALWANASAVRRLDPDDVSDAVLFLASNASQHITGLNLKVDAGNSIR